MYLMFLKRNNEENGAYIRGYAYNSKPFIKYAKDSKYRPSPIKIIHFGAFKKYQTQIFFIEILYCLTLHIFEGKE